MQIGIFAKTFVRPTLEEVLDAIKTRGFDCVQFNLACAGLPTLPDQIDSTLFQHIRAGMAQRGISMAAVSGTFNMIDPDLEKRRIGLRGLGRLITSCEQLGTSIVTICTGTRDPENMWRRHSENSSSQAWRDLLGSVSEAVRFAEEAGVTLALEPEVANVVDSAPKARLFLDEIQSSRLRVVIDPANLFHTGQLPEMNKVLDEAFDLLGQDIVLAHAKDISRDGKGDHAAAGTGLLDYDRYLSLLDTVGFEGPVILHGLTEAEVPNSAEFLRSKLTSLSHARTRDRQPTTHTQTRIYQAGKSGDIS